MCETNEEGTKNDQGSTCVNGVWVDDQTVDDRDMGPSDMSKKNDGGPTSDVKSKPDLDYKPDLESKPDLKVCLESEIECEQECVNIQTSATHCGDCGESCEEAELCSDGVCKNRCETPTPDFCENSCVDTTSSLMYCGDCNTQCAAPASSEAVCDLGICGFTCNDGFADCDGDANNGCEVDLSADPLNCGACGREGVPEVCGDQIDNDCNGVKDDGPPEICDGIDNNCDQKIDEGCPDGVVTSASDFTTHPLYGSQVGGSSFSDECPDGEVLYRFSGNFEGNIDRLRGHCASLVFESDTTVTPYSYSITRGSNSALPRHGNIETASFNITCPTNRIAVGLIAVYSGGITGVGLQCAQLIISENGGVYSIAHGAITEISVLGTNQGTRSTESLSAPAVIGAIRGRSDGFIDALGMGDKKVMLTFQ